MVSIVIAISISVISSMGIVISISFIISIVITVSSNNYQLRIIVISIIFQGNFNYRDIIFIIIVISNELANWSISMRKLEYLKIKMSYFI